MIATIRPARRSDRDDLAVFTTDTFSWGDYVLDRFDDWLDEPRSRVNVAVDDSDTVVGIARGVLLSPTEAWLSGARVHPEYRRQGVASQLGGTLLDWARSRGALVARLAIEDWNTPARAQVEAVGMRPVARFARAVRSVESAPPSPDGNGGTRAPASVRLAAAPAQEAEAAFMSWASSELSRAVRGLFAIGWTWRRLTVADLEAAAAGGVLWTAPGGWIMAAATGDALDVGWCDVAPPAAAGIASGLVDHAAEMGVASVAAMLPATGWLEDAFADAGYELTRIQVFAIGL